MDSLLKRDSLDWSKLIFSVFKLDASDDFLRCADQQLTTQFEKITALKDERIRIIWTPHSGFNHESGPISRIELPLIFRYGGMRVWASWKSKSGKIIKISDEGFDCNDLEFWFEDLDIAECKHRMTPKWSLITFRDQMIHSFAFQLNYTISNEFIKCLDEQLTAEFSRITGLTMFKHIGLSAPDKLDLTHDHGVSYMTLSVYVDHWPKRTKVAWKSFSGKIYRPDDSYISCSDLKFWFEEIDVPFIFEHLKLGSKVPFGLSKLSYELTVASLTTDCTIELVPKNGVDFKSIKDQFDNFIDDFNKRSESRKRKSGLVHSWEVYHRDGNIICGMDLGSAGHPFLKELLKFFSTLEAFEKVTVGAE